jgi:hypothetical protein
MTVSHSAEDRVLGGERQSDGLWVHKGKLSVGPAGTAGGGQPGDLSVSRGPGATTGAIYFGGLGAPQYIYWTGTAWQFQPGLTGAAIADGSLGTADLATNAVHNMWSLQLAPAGSTTSTTAVPMPSTFGTGLVLTGYTGAPLLIQGLIQLYHSVANVSAQIHLYVNGVDQNIRFTVLAPAVATVNFIVPVMAVLTLAAGAPAIQMYWSTGSGTLNSQTGLYQWLVAQEIKR